MSTTNGTSEQTEQDRDQVGHGDRTEQYITFTIGDEEYGIDIMAVREIKGWTETSSLPNAPDYMRGVINLRGLIVPIFDLRKRFGAGATEATDRHVIMVVAVESRIIGILVDAVSDILTITSDDIKPVPEMEQEFDNALLSGLVTVDDRMVALLRLEHLFDVDGIEERSETAPAASEAA